MLLCLIAAPAALAAEHEENLVPDVQQNQEDVESVLAWDLSSLWEIVKDAADQALGGPLRFAAQAVVYLLFSCAAGLVAGQGGWQKCIDAVAVLGFGAISLAGMMDLIGLVGQTAQDCQTYLIGFVPIYSAAAAAGGQTSGAAVYSTMFFAMSNFLSGAIRVVLLPVMQIYFCFGVSAAVWGNAGIAEAASLFSRCLFWLLKCCATLFSFVLGLQNVLAGSIDNAAVRMGRGVLSGAIPVVGDAAAAALTGAVSAVQLLKGSLALAALLALAAAFVPVFLQCLFYGAAFATAGAAALAGGQRSCGQLCRLYLEGTKLCASILVLYFFMVFLSTALLLITGNGG